MRLNEAREKLERAQLLDPSNKQVTATLFQVNLQIEQQRALQTQEEHHAESPVAVADQGQEIVVTELLKDSEGTDSQAGLPKRSHETFAEDQEEIPSPHRRWIEAASHWSSIIKPFLLDNVGWFVGAFMVVAGFVVLIFTFWSTIEQNRILMQSLVFSALAVATGMFFSLAYFMRVKYPQLETSSNVLLVIVALLIPLVFAAAVLTSLVPAASSEVTLIESPDRSLAGIPDRAGRVNPVLGVTREDGVTS
jgi:hypothetical protein